MVRRTKQAAEQTRTLILDTAEAVFSQRGVSRTTLTDIASAAGVTRGAIYWHFQNKADLFHAMIERVTTPMELMVSQSGDAQLADPLGYIRTCALACLQHTAMDPQAQRVFEIMLHKCETVDEMAIVRDRHIQSRDMCLLQIEQGFTHAVRKHLLPKRVNPRRAAVGLHALIDGLISNWVLDPRYFALGKECHKVIDTYLAGLKV